jgi:hypothetical protein
MVNLIKNTQGELINEIKGNNTLISSVICEIQKEDYVNIYGFTGLLQNFTKIPITKKINTPNPFGYKKPIGIIEKNIEISY